MIDVDALFDGVRSGDRTALGRAITLVESTRDADRRAAGEFLSRLLHHTGDAVRLGISGVPGVGKSTFIEALGTKLIQRGHRLAVLTVDPSSNVSGGSILGDKTRMISLARLDAAFIRPSPASGSLGGVTRRTRETMLVCEAAGFDVVIVETVGVGQSETRVADMVDLFLLLLLPGGGDELQGIKRGILEVADLVAINKADGDNVGLAARTVAEYASALRLVRGADDGERWIAAGDAVTAVSALDGTGIDDLWTRLLDARGDAASTGRLEAKRQRQLISWMWSAIDDGLRLAFRDHPGVRDALDDAKTAVRAGTMSPAHAADVLLRRFLDAGPGERS